MKINKVALIVPPTSEAEGSTCGNRGCWQPLGPLALATQISLACPEVEVRILDGNILCLDVIKAEVVSFRPEFVGLSVLTPTAKIALHLVQFIRQELGPDVIVVEGNDHASRNLRYSLLPEKEVDAVAIGDNTHHVLPQVIQKGNIVGITNLGYGWGDEIVVPGRKDVYRLQDLPVPNRQLLDIRPYRDNYQSLYGKWHSASMTPVTVNFAKGCAHASQILQPGITDPDRCAYCDIWDLAMQTRSSQQVWEEVGLLVEQFGSNLILNEVCDSFTSFRKWIRQLLNARPTTIPSTVRWLVYARAQELVQLQGLADLLAGLGVIRVNMGVDHGDDGMLNSLNKWNAQGTETNLRAAELLRDRGIQMFISFVLGVPGETEKSLQNLLKHAEQLLQVGNVVCIDPSPLVPLPGAPIWAKITSPESAKELMQQHGLKGDANSAASYFAGECRDLDFVDLDEMCRRFVQYFCYVSYDDVLIPCLQELYRLAEQYGAVPGGYGVPGRGWT